MTNLADGDLSLSLRFLRPVGYTLDQLDCLLELLDRRHMASVLKYMEFDTAILMTTKDVEQLLRSCKWRNLVGMAVYDLDIGVAHGLG